MNVEMLIEVPHVSPCNVLCITDTYSKQLSQQVFGQVSSEKCLLSF